MKTELFPFQKKALLRLRNVTAEALGSFHRTHTPQIIAFTAPTGAGKTIILAALIEDIYFGDEQYAEQPDAIFVWLSDSPELNEQSRGKIDLKADRIRLDQCVTISDNSFDSEFLEDGHIYFLNTQKLGKSSNLTKHSDSRQYTIWETLRNTAREKADRLYFVIDEAHRGMQGREAGKATTIMQKFIKGSTEDGLAPMPIVIGMSATIERFYALAADTPSTTQKASVTPDEVRASGLLKDRIVITYPDETLVNKDMGVLQAAADEWKDKWEHWAQYCTEQHYAQVNPVFVVQVQNGSGDKISDTDLDDCLRKIEERTGFHFQAGEVVHTFGQMSGSLSINGLDVRCEEPSRIAEDRNIKVVFFKENLSTGWDCPRAETMMSFRRAGDATYIAQLLGRMVRTPMQMHIQVDDTLNDVHLYLPWFDQATVQNVVDALQSSEGGNIPTDIYEEGINERKFDTLTVKPLRTSSTGSGRREVDSPQQIHIEEPPQQPEGEDAYETFPLHTESRTPTTQQEQTSAPAVPADETKAVETSVTPSAQMPGTSPEAESRPEETFNREDVVRAINDAGLLTYDVRSLRINNYQISLYKMARLLSHCGLYPDAAKDVVNDVVGMIHDYVERLKSEGQYEERVTQAKQFRLSAQIFDVFGKTVDNYQVHDLFSTTDTDIDRQFRRAETKLGNEGVGNAYGRHWSTPDAPDDFKLDVILFAADGECLAELNTFAEKRFHDLNDQYRRRMTNLEERFRKQYDSIVSDGDTVSKHNFCLPETINVEHASKGERYSDHLFVNDSGYAFIALNGWEKGVLAEEQQRSDYVCWLRNPPRKSWSLRIPYKDGGDQKATYPDFLIVRRDAGGGYVVDILEPHNPDYTDNLSKAKGFAEYARQNPGVGRIELIRMKRDASGINRFIRLDMARSAVRDRVSHAASNDELDHIFDMDGQFE